MARVKLSTSPARGWSMFIYTALTLATLSLVPTSDAQPPACNTVGPAFPQCDCRGTLNDRGEETLNVILDCSNRGLTSVPKSPLSSTLQLHEFRLVNNSITQLDSDSFQNVKARVLDLSGNNLTLVNDDAFAPFADDLQELHMDGDSNSSPSVTALGRLTAIEILTLRDYDVEYPGDTEHVYFLGMPQLKQLTLHNWKINALEPDVFKGATSLLSLTLTNNPNMHNVPTGGFQGETLRSLTSLKISGTNIQELTNEAFSTLTSLRELDLSNNHISQLRLNCFDSLGPSLRKLSLSSNFLDSTTSEMDGLKNLPSLEELDLSGNENIEIIPDLSQLNAQTSVKVTLSNNKISSLPANAFNGIAPRLHTLDLSRNKISRMDPLSFNGVNNLQELRLSQQSGVSSLTLTLPESISQSASSLKRLYLNGQTLDASSVWSKLDDMDKLEVLDLSHTGLSRIPNLAFVKMTLLQELYLTGNSLTSLNEESLVGPRFTLSLIHLSQNPLTSISSCIFEGYNFPVTMALHASPLNCDCKLSWLLNQAIQQNVKFISGHEPTCSNFNNELLLSKNENDICSDNKYEDAPCNNFYTSPTLTLTLDKITNNSITLSWRLSDSTDLRSFSIKVSNVINDFAYSNPNLPTNTFQLVASPLPPDTQHTVCVVANFLTRNSITECTVTTTLPNGSDKQGQTDSSDSADVGIIIGAVVGAILLLLVLAAIAYLVFVRRRPKKGSGTISAPVQPRNFTKAELPSMTEDSRTFTRPKQPIDQHDGMQVVAISDGQVNNQHTRNGSARVGRAARLYSDGSYKVMSASSIGATSTGSESQSVYENEHGLLPRTPHRYDHGLRGPRQPGYYNEGFQADKYDEIDRPMREVTL